MLQLNTQQPDYQAKLEAFCAAASAKPEVVAAVSSILADVKARGDAAVAEHTARIDGARLEPSQFRVPASELEAAETALTSEQRAAVRSAMESVETFHRMGLRQSWRGRNTQGAEVGEIYHPIRRVGLWIPGGSVPLVSTVLMTAVPAKLAGVPEIAVFTPPGREGKVSPALLAALRMCGITEVYRLGGVMAVGVMAYGTQTIRPVDKVFGPGNDYVIEAKRQVFGTIGVDLLPGPSEVMILADSTAEPALVAADLLAQAEHGSGKEKVYLVTTDASLTAKVEAALDQQLATLSHADKIRKVLAVGAVSILAPDLAAAVSVANYVAPEHLELHTRPETFDGLLRDITTAGAILLGRNTPTVLGDFTAGPSHTLPTGRAGRFCSGLRLEDFYRRTSFVRYDPASLAKARPVVATFAAMEQLDAHGRSLEIRF